MQGAVFTPLRRGLFHSRKVSHMLLANPSCCKINTRIGGAGVDVVASSKRGYAKKRGIFNREPRLVQYNNRYQKDFDNSPAYDWDNMTRAFKCTPITKAEIQELFAEREAGKNQWFTLVDVRSEYRINVYGWIMPMLPHAIHFPLKEMIARQDALAMDENDFKTVMGFDKPDESHDIIVYAETPEAGEIAAKFFEFSGYPNVYHYEGGVRDWYDKIPEDAYAKPGENAFVGTTYPVDESSIARRRDPNNESEFEELLDAFYDNEDQYFEIEDDLRQQELEAMRKAAAENGSEEELASLEEGKRVGEEGEGESEGEGEGEGEEMEEGEAPRHRRFSDE